MGRQRLGVVILVPQPLATEVEGLRRALGDGSRPRIVPHCTLVSPVNVPDRELPAALAVLREAAAATPPLTLAVGPAASFHPVTPVAYLQVAAREDTGALQELRRRLDVDPLARSTDHPYEPHVTICDDLSEERAGAAIAALSDFRVDVAVDRIHLMGVGPSGAWRAIADAPLGGDGGEVGRGSLPLELRTTGRPDPEAGGAARLRGGAAGRALRHHRPARRRRRGRHLGMDGGRAARGRRPRGGAAHRNQGIGRHLLAAVEDLARRRGASVLGTSSAAGGAPGALLSGAGWGTVGEPDPEGRRRWERLLGPAG
jgi:2'-5' RNA ligase